MVRPAARPTAYLRSSAITVATATRPPTLLEQLGYPSAMVRDERVAAQLAELEQLRPASHRRAMVRHAIADRELDLAGEPVEPLFDLRVDDELLNGLNLILELLA